MIYDLIIVGAGPAGLAAGIYAGRYMLKTLIIEKAQDGGQISQTAEIENYPGLRVDVPESGLTLSDRMTEQVKRFGAERALDEIVSFELQFEVKKLTGLSGKVYEARSVILAMGAHYRSIGCKNEDKFRGMGISFCATCDANFFRGLDVYVAGGGDSAIEEAMYLTKFARKVTVIHRRNELRAAKSIQEKAFANEKLSFIWDSVVDEALGDVPVGLDRQAVMDAAGDADGGGDDPGGVRQLLFPVLLPTGAALAGDLEAVGLIHREMAALGADDADEICHFAPSLTALPPQR